MDLNNECLVRRQYMSRVFNEPEVARTPNLRAHCVVTAMRGMKDPRRCENATTQHLLPTNKSPEAVQKLSA